jgi:hypothetical protein
MYRRKWQLKKNRWKEAGMVVPTYNPSTSVIPTLEGGGRRITSLRHCLKNKSIIGRRQFRRWLGKEQNIKQKLEKLVVLTNRIKGTPNSWVK